MERIDKTPIRRYMKLIEHFFEKEYLKEQQALDDAGL